MVSFNALGANVGYIRHDTVVISETAVTQDTVKIMKNVSHFRVRD